jgi:hypothetical protein
VREQDERVLVALNFGSRRMALGPGAEDQSPATIELSTEAGRAEGQVDLGTLVLGPSEGVILRLGAVS